MLELIPKTFEQNNKRTVEPASHVLEDIAHKILAHWGFEQPFFVDLWHLPSDFRCEDGSHPFITFCGYAQDRDLRFIPVTGLDPSRTTDYQSVIASFVKENSQGACIRLQVDDMLNPQLKRDLDKLLQRLRISPSEVDLVIDYQCVEKLDSACISPYEISNLVPFLQSWRTFTFISGAFPVDLTQVGRNTQKNLPRNDWILWSNQIKSGQWASRIPSYGDYTIQYGKYVRNDHPGSASIRYTSDDYWVIIRGQLLSQGPGHQQYPALAQLLCEREEFCGPEYSCGDKYIYDMNLAISELGEVDHPGSPTTWLQAGINHHIVFVLRQLANLSLA